MRRLWALAFAPLLALGFVMLGSGPANAFGSEVLGCSVDGAAWTASTCDGGGYPGAVGAVPVEFAAHNLSGTYTYAWTVTGPAGAITSSCSSITSQLCISRGCTSTSSVCDIQVNGTPLNDRTYTASLKLTQSGLSRTISASALIYAGEQTCRTC